MIIRSILTVFIPFLLAGSGAVARADSLLPLAGEWRFALDPKGVGETEKWHAGELADFIKLPGTIAQNQKGPRTEPTEKTDSLSSEYNYAGWAWYQRTITIPQDWDGRAVELFLERTKLTKVWLDDTRLGAQDALGVAQVYQLGKLTPGTHRLTILVDSKTYPPGVPGHSHMLDTSTGTRWNGVIGDLHLRAHDPVWIETMRVTTNVVTKVATVTLSIGNTTGSPQRGQIKMAATAFNVPKAKGRKPLRLTGEFTAPPGGATLTLSLPLGADPLLWDEFHPALYTLVTALETEATDGKTFRHTVSDEFGLRDFRAKDGQFTINGRATLLRGKHEAMVFPITGHVAMDLEEWVRVLTIAKSYGITSVR